MGRLRAIATIAFVLTGVTACTPNRPNDPDLFQAQSDIHERLSEVISRDGFGHALRSQRDSLEHFDEIRIGISLDSLKGRHLSLEKLMTDIGRICASPSYAYLPIRILIGAGDDDDQMYLFSILATAVKGRANIALITATDSRNEIVITVRHPGKRGN